MNDAPAGPGYDHVFRDCLIYDGSGGIPFAGEDRGRIAAGAFADLVVFDPEAIIDHATYDEPRRPAAGVEKVFVNGELSFDAGAVVKRAGRLVGGKN
jgi:N-acyl-D-aspartate/D-glutamate deacylase